MSSLFLTVAGIIFLGFTVFFCLLALITESFSVVLMSWPCMALMCLCFYSADHRDADVSHHQALTDLRKAGWVVSDKQLNGTHSVTFNCVTLDVTKLDNVYVVTKDRPENQGGGYQIISSSAEAKLKSVCP